MKSISLVLVFNLFLFGVVSSQCVLPSGTYSWGLTQLSDHITNNCGGVLNSGLILPTDAIISIKNNDPWDLTAYGAFTFTIQGNGSLNFNGTDELITAAGSSLIIEDTANTEALNESGMGTNIRIIIGTTTFTGDEFDAIIAAGGANQDGLLPIDLLSFTSKVNQEFQIELSWETIIENNNSHFVIEHSNNGLSFDEIGIVIGSGNSVNYQNYHFTHVSPMQGTNYYRLKQVDYNGGFSYIKTIIQDFRTSSSFILKHQTYSSLGFEIKQPAKIYIFDLSGKLVNLFSLETGIHNLNLSELYHGQYVILIHSRLEENVVRIIR